MHRYLGVKVKRVFAEYITKVHRKSRKNMRYSCIKDDPGYKNFMMSIVNKHPIITVYCDGHEVKHCHTADDELGIAWCRKYDDDGKVALLL